MDARSTDDEANTTMRKVERIKRRRRRRRGQAHLGSHREHDHARPVLYPFDALLVGIRIHRLKRLRADRAGADTLELKQPFLNLGTRGTRGAQYAMVTVK